jgi:uncharacterized protein
LRGPHGAFDSSGGIKTAELRDVVGGLAWNELSTTNPKRAATFYGELLGWSCGAGEGFLAVQHADVVIGVIRGQDAEERGRPPNWLPCFPIDDLDAVGRRAMALGGRVLGPAADAPPPFTGVTVRLADPLGVAVWEGR